MVEAGFVDLIGEGAWSTARIPSLGLYGVYDTSEYIGSHASHVDALPRNLHVKRILVMLSASHGARQGGTGEYHCLLASSWRPNVEMP